MPRPDWKILLVCLLLLALPLKGMAAGMTACGPGHAAALAGQLGDVATGHDRAGHSLPAHDHAGHGHAEGHPAQHGDAADTPQGAHGKCSSCAPCCSGAMMCGRAMPALTAAVHADRPPAPLSRYHSADLAGPDRPPRGARC